MNEIVKVQFPSKAASDGFGGKEYSYFASLPLKVGDLVKAGQGKARVTRVNVGTDEIGADIKHLGTISSLLDVESVAVVPKSASDVVVFDGGDAPVIVPLSETCPELATFRFWIYEFANLSDEIVCQALEHTRSWVSRRQFRRLTSQAVVYLTAHRLKLAKKSYEASQGIYPTSSISEDGASWAFAIGSINLDMSNAALKETEHGRVFLSMRQPMIGT